MGIANSQVQLATKSSITTGAAMQRFDGEESLYNPQDDWLGSNFEIFPVDDVSGPISNVADLCQIMGAGRQAHTCFANLWRRHAMRRDLLDTDNSADKICEKCDG